MLEVQANAPWKMNPEDNEDVAWALSTAEALLGRGERQEAIRWVRRAAEQAADAGEDDRALELAKSAADLASESDAAAAPPARPAEPAPPIDPVAAAPAAPAPEVITAAAEGEKADVPVPPPAPAETAPAEPAAGEVPAATAKPEPEPEQEPAHPRFFADPAVDPWATEGEAAADDGVLTSSAPPPSSRPSSRADMMADMLAAARRSEPPSAPLEPTPVVSVTSELPPVPSTGFRHSEELLPSAPAGVSQAIRVMVSPREGGGASVVLAGRGEGASGAIEALLVGLTPGIDLLAALSSK